MAAPINKQPDEVKPTGTVQAHQVQLVQEIDEPQVSKQEVVKPVEVTQGTPKDTGCESHKTEINKYNWNVNIAMAIMKAESGCRTVAVGDQRVIGGIYAPSCGLFQIRTLKGRPSCEQLKDPATNIAWAYRLYSGNSWRPWSVYNNGKYLKYM